MTTQFVETAKVLPKGQITIPRDIRELLGVGIGDRVMLVWDGEKVVMRNLNTVAEDWLDDQTSDQVDPSTENTAPQPSRNGTIFRNATDAWMRRQNQEHPE